MKSIVSEYAWLIDAIRPHCDEVLTSVSDFDQRLIVGARWGVNQAAILVEAPDVSDGAPAWFSLNREIAKGGRSRADVILDLLAKRPDGIPARMAAP